MEERQRLKRQDPERVAPIRNWSTVFRSPESPKTSDREDGTGAAAPRNGSGFGDGVTNAVKLAYRVADENIRLGKRVAQQLNDRTYDLGAMRGDFQDLTERTVRSLTDLTALWFETLGSLLGAARSAGQSGTEKARDGGGAGVSVDVMSTQPAQVTLDLQPRARDWPLTVYALRAPDPTCPPLTDVALEPAKDGRGVRIRLRVPPGQPAGQYSAVVVDSKGMPCGTLAVRVGDAAREASPKSS